MQANRLRTVEKQKDKIDLYYFSLQEAAENLNVPEAWILQQLSHLLHRIVRQGTWYFSPDDYHKLKELRDAT